MNYTIRTIRKNEFARTISFVLTIHTGSSSKRKIHCINYRMLGDLTLIDKDTCPLLIDRWNKYLHFMPIEDHLFDWIEHYFNTDLRNISLDVRAINGLFDSEIYTVDDLKSTSLAKIKRMAGIGNQSMQLIIDYLEKN